MNQQRNPLLLFLPMGFFLGGCGLLLAFVHPPNTPEFVLSVCSALMGGFLIMGAVIVRWMGRGL
jgi:hypothetical protein